MSSPSNKQKALAEAVSRLLRPIVRMLLRNSMPFAALEALAKQVYVEVAFEEFAIPGKRPTISRASVLLGLTRKEVQRLVNERMIDDSERPDFHNRAMRVLTAWVRDPKYHDGNSKPLALDPEGAVSFSTLVKRHSGDMPPGAVMDELLRVGAIRRVANGQLALAQRAYVPAGGQIEKLAMLGTDVADLIRRSTTTSSTARRTHAFSARSCTRTCRRRDPGVSQSQCHQGAGPAGAPRYLAGQARDPARRRFARGAARTHWAGRLLLRTVERSSRSTKGSP